MYNFRFKLDSPSDYVVLLNTSVAFVCQRTVYYQSESLLSLDNETPSLFVGLEVVNSCDDIFGHVRASLDQCMSGSLDLLDLQIRLLCTTLLITRAIWLALHRLANT